MGITSCTCKRSDTEEEIITKIFKALIISEQNANEVYRDFMFCIPQPTTSTSSDNLSTPENKNTRKSHLLTDKIDKTSYENFICKIVNPVQYRDAQADYFETLIQINDVSINGIKRIGVVLIFFSDGEFMDKINLLEKHIEKYYGKLDRHFKDFISDVIDLNTDMCLLAFKNYIGEESHQFLTQVWKKPRKQKLIKKLINIYEEMRGSVSQEKEDKWALILNKFLISSYNNLTGESIRSYLYEQFMLENNKLIMAKK